MKILQVRNVQEALPRALRLLDNEGVERSSRNGPVLLGPSVTTVYERPCERVIFWPERDANPFFHLYEALWMLAGRNDVAGPARYAKNMVNYSDDGETFHGAYGHRWRRWLADWSKPPSKETGLNARLDQLELIAIELRENPDSRRCVLQMWDGQYDLGRSGKDLPCNLTVTFQRGIEGELNLTVFCRSNDIIWGAYGANAVHFSVLLEYMALWIGCAVGTYTQVSVNWHAYLDAFEKVKSVRPDRVNFVDNPYIDRRVHVTPLSGSIERVDELIYTLLEAADEGHLLSAPDPPEEPWAAVVHYMLQAHERSRQRAYANSAMGKERYTEPLAILAQADQQNDWIVAGTDWIQRRYDAWQKKQ